MFAQRQKSKPAKTGGARTLLYVVVAAIVIYFVITAVLPLLTPKPPPPGPSISLTPPSDISGSSVIIGGKSLAPNSTVTAKYDNTSIALSGTCKTDSKGILFGCSFIVPKSGSGSYLVEVNDGVNVTSARFTIPSVTIPESTFLVILTSLSLGLTTQLVTRRVVNLSAERRMKAELSEFNKEKRQAKLADDKAKLEKLKKRELAMRQEQSKVQLARFKVSAITIVPLFLVYYLMATVLGGYGVTVANTPFIHSGWPVLVSPEGTMSLFWWYFLSSFVMSSLLSKALHTTT